MKYANNGVIPFVMDSAALNINCENCGDIFSCINIGTITGDIIVHFDIDVGINIFAIAIITIDIINNARPDSGNIFKKLVKATTIIVGMFVSLNIDMNCDAKKLQHHPHPHVYHRNNISFDRRWNICSLLLSPSLMTGCISYTYYSRLAYPCSQLICVWFWYEFYS